MILLALKIESKAIPYGVWPWFTITNVGLVECNHGLEGGGGPVARVAIHLWRVRRPGIYVDILHVGAFGCERFEEAGKPDDLGVATNGNGPQFKWLGCIMDSARDKRESATRAAVIAAGNVADVHP